MIINLLAWLLSTRLVSTCIIAYAKCRPYKHLGGYMGRYWVFNPYPNETHIAGWARWPSIRIHHIKRSDTGRDLHDHPWHARTFILRGGYIEERINRTGVYRKAGTTSTLKYREYHRITAVIGDVWTLFVTWPYQGDWGFLVDGEHVPHKEYHAKRDAENLMVRQMKQVDKFRNVERTVNAQIEAYSQLFGIPYGVLSTDTDGFVHTPGNFQQHSDNNNPVDGKQVVRASRGAEIEGQAYYDESDAVYRKDVEVAIISTGKLPDDYKPGEPFAVDVAPPYEPSVQWHVFYKDGDTGVPEAIQDRIGNVVLTMCKVCGQAESELEPTCPGRDPRDIASDPEGKLVVDPAKQLYAKTVTEWDRTKEVKSKLRTLMIAQLGIFGVDDTGRMPTDIPSEELFDRYKKKILSDLCEKHNVPANATLHLHNMNQSWPEFFAQMVAQAFPNNKEGK
jgi:hypothetical protein